LVYSILILLLMLMPLLPSHYTRGSDFAVVVGFHVLAKNLEETDRQVFALGQIGSGHTLKHLGRGGGLLDPADVREARIHRGLISWHGAQKIALWNEGPDSIRPNKG
jgi:hypothetical protein